MNERDYILAGNIKAVRIADRIVREMYAGPRTGMTEAEQRRLARLLSRIEVRLAKWIEDES